VLIHDGDFRRVVHSDHAGYSIVAPLEEGFEDHDVSLELFCHTVCELEFELILHDY
jgi:hypothetical protein